MLSNLLFTLIPVLAATIGAVTSVYYRPGEKVMSIIHHFTAGIVFAAAATEILPDLKEQSMLAVALGGATGIMLMLIIKYFGEHTESNRGLITTVGIDLLIDGLVLGIAFAAGAKTGLLLTLALTLEVLFLGLSVVNELHNPTGNKLQAILVVTGLALLVPAGVLAGSTVAGLSQFWLTFFLSFGLIALLYLVTEELLVEAHAADKDTPAATAMFFIGFIILLLLEGTI